MRYWLPTIAWMLLIFILSSRPAVTTSHVDWQDFFLKKTAHFVEYFILAWLLYRSLKHTTNFSPALRLFTTLSLTFIYAASDEFHQTFVPGREGRLRDVIIDAVGATSAGVFKHKYTTG